MSIRVTAVFAAAFVMSFAAAPAGAQSEAACKSYFEGRRVTVRIDMPGTSDGVDVHPDGARAVDLNRYKENLKRYGTAIRAGDVVVVTLVKVKKDLIEFQLAGGGFGTAGDDTSTSVYVPSVDKSEREKTLERLVRDENDRDRKRELQRELDSLHDRRERENRRIEIERARLEEVKKARVAEQRIGGGSRFNLRYDNRVPDTVRPEDIAAALADYVDFRQADAAVDAPRSPGATEPSGDITMLRKGMTRSDAERAFGRPAESSRRTADDLAVTTLVFLVGDHRVTAEFVEDVLVRYTIASK